MSLQTYALFPLNLVLFPGGYLPLRIFETRYLDMVTSCIKNQLPFGVVAVDDDAYPLKADTLPFAHVGTLANIVHVDVPQTGLMHIRCEGQQRFRVKSAHQQSDTLWVGEVELIKDDVELAVPDDLVATSDSLHQLINALIKQGVAEPDIPILKPYRFDDCGRVANRWCELLNLPLKQKQRMLELDSPLIRLELVNDMFASSDQDS